MKLWILAIAGSLGAVARYALSGLVMRYAPPTFPYGTLVVNIVGCFVIGLVGAFFAQSHVMVKPEYRAAILIGFLGAFTTFSTFGFETLELAREGAFLRAGMNVIASNVFGLAAVWIGYRLSQAAFGA